MSMVDVEREVLGYYIDSQAEFIHPIKNIELEQAA